MPKIRKNNAGSSSYDDDRMNEALKEATDPQFFKKSLFHKKTLVKQSGNLLEH